MNFTLCIKRGSVGRWCHIRTAVGVIFSSVIFVFNIKMNNGLVDTYKSRLVVNGSK